MKNMEMNALAHARLETKDSEPVLLEHVRMEGDLHGLLLEMAVKQGFRNQAPHNVEVVYTFQRGIHASKPPASPQTPLPGWPS
jgi:hypothetical protein